MRRGEAFASCQAKMRMSSPNKSHSNIEVLFSAEAIAARVSEVARAITQGQAGRELHVVAVLKGACIFVADLMRAIALPQRLDFIGISSYGDAQVSSGVVEITQDLGSSIEGHHVLVVEDIIDTGLTMRYLLDNLATRRPASLQVATLLHKPDNAKVSLDIEHVGFTIPDRFVVGYGMDLAGLYRDLPYIGVYDAGH